MKILIAIPTFENIEPDTFKAIYGLKRPENATVMFDYVKGYDVARARNMIAKEALEYGFDYVFMVDSDVVLPSDALERLVALGKDVATGWYPRKRTTTGQTEVFLDDGQRDFTDECNLSTGSGLLRFARNDTGDVVGEEPVAIKGCGLGCALIKTDVFRQLGESRWFEYVEYANGGLLSEDTGFCSKVRSAGYEIWLEPQVACGHVGKVIQRR